MYEIRTGVQYWAQLAMCEHEAGQGGHLYFAKVPLGGAEGGGAGSGGIIGSARRCTELCSDAAVVFLAGGREIFLIISIQTIVINPIFKVFP